MKKYNIFFFVLMVLIGLNCSKEADFEPVNSNVAISGSYAKSLLIGDRLFLVSNAELMTFDLSNGDEPVEIDRQAVAQQIESLYYFQGKLFVGSGEGMFIYTIENGKPNQLSATNYAALFDVVYPCDPIIANDSFAFVTLNTSVEISACGRPVSQQINQLNIFDITDLANPLLLAEYPLANPKGLAKDGDLLFVCNGKLGLVVYDASSVPTLTKLTEITGFEAYDVITLEGLLLVIGPDNVYQFDYSDPTNIIKISEIPYGE